MKLYNRDKNRNATPNEIAKFLIVEVLDQGFMYENDLVAELSDSDQDEVARFLRKHQSAIRKRLYQNIGYK